MFVPHDNGAALTIHHSLKHTLFKGEDEVELVFLGILKPLGRPLHLAVALNHVEDAIHRVPASSRTVFSGAATQSRKQKMCCVYLAVGG